MALIDVGVTHQGWLTLALAHTRQALLTNSSKSLEHGGQFPVVYGERGDRPRAQPVLISTLGPLRLRIVGSTSCPLSRLSADLLLRYAALSRRGPANLPGCALSARCTRRSLIRRIHARGIGPGWDDVRFGNGGAPQNW